ncbi:diguanylate cyclase [Neobacillus pocheonensis]|uniref:GGDEF domain-containing protein n=1 Tax=Neobacillus pocheonensis TaxID=363869 RepID=UPI003D2CEF04
MLYTHPDLLPGLLLLALLLAMTTMGFMLYQRWLSRSYLIFTVTQAAAASFFLLIVSAAIFNSNSNFVGLLLASLSVTAFIAVQTGFLILFQPKTNKELYIYFCFAAGSIFLGILSIFVSGLITSILLTVLTIVFTAYFYLKAMPKLPKRNKFNAAMSINTIAVLLQIAYLIEGSPAILALQLTASLGYYAVMFYIFFERIVDLMEAVSYSSVMDGLTSLYNKNYFKKKVAEALHTGKTSYVLFSDIDNFKKLNDTLGHQVGDEMLKFVARILKETCNDMGLAGRYGGEEMVALFTHPRMDMNDIAELFRARVEEESKAITPVTVSVGICKSRPDVTAEEFIKMADEAMYRAKHTGKNKVIDFDEMDEVESQPSIKEAEEPAVMQTVELTHELNSPEKPEVIHEVAAAAEEKEQMYTITPAAEQYPDLSNKPVAEQENENKGVEQPSLSREDHEAPDHESIEKSTEIQVSSSIKKIDDALIDAMFPNTKTDTSGENNDALSTTEDQTRDDNNAPNTENTPTRKIRNPFA